MLCSNLKFSDPETSILMVTPLQTSQSCLPSRWHQDCSRTPCSCREKHFLRPGFKRLNSGTSCILWHHTSAPYGGSYKRTAATYITDIELKLDKPLSGSAGFSTPCPTRHNLSIQFYSMLLLTLTWTCRVRHSGEAEVGAGRSVPALTRRMAM